MGGEQTTYLWNSNQACTEIFTKLPEGLPITTQTEKLTMNSSTRNEGAHFTKSIVELKWGSEQMLVMAPLSLKLRKAKRGEEKQLRFDVGKLRNPDVEKAFKLTVKLASVSVKINKN